MAKRSEVDIEIIEKAVHKARDEIESFEDVDYIGNRPVFVLCQYLKGIDMPDTITIKDLKPYVKRWYEISETQLFDKYDELPSFTEVWAQFVEVWPKIKYPKSAYLEQAKQRAKKRKVPLLELAELDEKYQYLGAVCYELQQITGREPFWLSTYDAGNILGKCQKTGYRAMKMFVFEGVLKRTKVGHTGLASEYRYISKADTSSGKKLTPSELEKRKQKILEELKS